MEFPGRAGIGRTNIVAVDYKAVSTLVNIHADACASKRNKAARLQTSVAMASRSSPLPWSLGMVLVATGRAQRGVADPRPSSTLRVRQTIIKKISLAAATALGGSR